MPAETLELTLTAHGELLAQFTLNSGQYVLGRAESCEIMVDLEGVSPQHARLCLEGEKGWIEDLHSERGTRLGGALIQGRAPIEPGQAIEFGDAVTLLIVPPPTALAKSRHSLKKNMPRGKAARRRAKEAREGSNEAVPIQNAPASPEQEQVALLRAELESLRSQHRTEMEALRAARAAAESDLRIARDALIVKQAAAARHLHELEQAHAARVQELEDEMKAAPVEPPVSPPPPEAPAVESAALVPAAPLQLEPIRPMRVGPRDNELANLVGLLHSREAQGMELRSSLRRAEERIAELHARLIEAEKKKVPVERWRSFSRVAAIVAVAAMTGLAVVAVNLQAERDRSEREEAIVRRIKSSAPRFGSDAVDLLENGDLGSALVKATAAIALDPQSAELRLVEGNILQSQLKLDAAAAAYREALALDPKLSLASTNLVLCQRILATRKGVASPESLYALHRTMMEQNRFREALRITERLPGDHQLLHRTWAALLEHAGLRGKLALNEENTFDLDLSGPGKVDLTPLTGMPLRTLLLGRSQVADLSPLRGFPLRRLDLSGTRIRDLSALEGMKLEQINLSDTDVSSLFALRGMPLREVNLDHTAVTSVSELHGMPLEILRLAGTRVWNTGPLAGLPLRTLDLGRTRIAEIASLEHLPIEWLNIEDTAVTDLTPLARSSLASLNLSRTPVTDLSPLAGLPLRELDLSGCTNLAGVASLTACGELERITVPRHCADLPALRRLPHLRFISFEPSDSEPAREQSAREFWLALGQK